MHDNSWHAAPRGPASLLLGGSPRRSSSLSSLTSFSSSMSIFQPTPPLDPASPPMPIPDTFELDADQDAATSMPAARPQTPATPPPPTGHTMPVTPPPSATRGSKRRSKTASSARPTKTALPQPARARARRPSKASPPRSGKRSPDSRPPHEEDTVAALRDENRTLRRAVWTLQNTNALLRARLLTGAEQVRHAHAAEAQLDHAQRYVRALRKQVRSLGGFVMRLGGGGRRGDGEREADADADSDDDDDDDDDDGELSAAHVPAYFPDAARHPQKYTMLEMQREKALGKKTKPTLKH